MMLRVRLSWRTRRTGFGRAGSHCRNRSWRWTL